MKTIFQACRLLLTFTLLTGLLYPLAVTGFARALFPYRAGGSLQVENGRLLGSELLAQKFEAPRYFWPRPSGADFATIPSGASNKGPTAKDLRQAIAARREKLGQDAPEEMLTASGSGLDPHVSPECARWQAARVAAARGWPVEKVLALVEHSIQGPALGFLGEPCVNILSLNRALDRL